MDLGKREIVTKLYNILDEKKADTYCGDYRRGCGCGRAADIKNP